MGTLGYELYQHYAEAIFQRCNTDIDAWEDLDINEQLAWEDTAIMFA